ncbi:MAG TPA: hypothetical protein VFO35_12115 [Steroidobacteraceae bacterium]|nr:hypothetical protein [Steroidobacteraceae bacterium]
MDLDKLRALIAAATRTPSFAREEGRVRSGLLAALCALAMATSPASGAEPGPLRKYAFELVTLNLSASARSRRDPTSGGRMQIDVASAMTDEELETVKRILDQKGASPPDGEGYRSFSMPNGARGRIAIIEDPEVAGAGVSRLPMEIHVAGEISAAQAALALQIAVAANLFVGKPDDPTVVATTYQVTDRPFRREHPRATVTPDDESLAEWIRQNIPAAEVADESGR